MGAVVTSLVAGNLHWAEPCARCGARPSSVCAAVDDPHLQQLASAAVQLEAHAGQTFITEGDPADNFFNVTAGTARIFKSLPDGRRQITGFASSGDFLGLAVSSQYGFSAEALDTVSYCRFSRRRLRLLLDDFPQLERRLLETASNELVAAQEQMLLLGRKTARERVASFLLLRTVSKLPCADPATVLHLPMTRSDIADYLGLTIETVSRTLSRLKADRLIGIPNNSEIVILQRGTLAEIAGLPI